MKAKSEGYVYLELVDHFISRVVTGERELRKCMSRR